MLSGSVTLELNCTASGAVPDTGSAAISTVGAWLAVAVIVTCFVSVALAPCGSVTVSLTL